MSSGNVIKSVEAREILDSRGKPTLEVEVITEDGVFKAGVPSGTSAGKHEAVALDAKKAVKIVGEIISPALEGKDPKKQKEIDRTLLELDGTENKSKLGANAICGVSMAVCRAGAAANKLSLYRHIHCHIADNLFSAIAEKRLSIPEPCFNVINGGVHADNDLDIQEFMAVPQMATFSENLKVGREIYSRLGDYLKKQYEAQTIKLGLEGGFAPNKMKSSREALDVIMKVSGLVGCDKNIKIVLDAASSEFFKNGKYQMKAGALTAEKLMGLYSDLIANYPILGLEDPFAEDDWEGWSSFAKATEDKQILLIGDDLLVTNPKRMKEAKEKDACNAAIIKINQIGTVSEAIEAARLAQSYGWKVVVSHRSGETKDDFIADFAVGIGADYIKAGAPAPPERMAKYNRLLQIENLESRK